MSINNSIRCNVESCRHHQNEHCSLKDITVGKNNCYDAKKCCETECCSFENL